MASPTTTCSVAKEHTASSYRMLSLVFVASLASLPPPGMGDPDFFAIVALANGGREVVPPEGPTPSAAEPPEAPRVLHHALSDGASPQLVGDPDLDMLAILAAERPQQHRHRQRSWQHAEQARHGKALKKARTELEAEREQRILAQQTTGLLARMLGQAFPCRDARRLMTPELAAMAKVAVACMLARRSSGSNDARAVAQLASCIGRVQAERLDMFFMHGGVPPPSADCRRAAVVGMRPRTRGCATDPLPHVFLPVGRNIPESSRGVAEEPCASAGSCGPSVCADHDGLRHDARFGHY